MITYFRLCLAYFLQFAIWGSWAGALGGYAGKALGFSGAEIGWLYAAIPLGAVIAPLFIGPIADRYFAAQKVASLLHLLGGLALILCGWICATGVQTFTLMMTLILFSGICFMPTIALVNSIVMKHLPNANRAPLVFVFGTIGWICVNLLIAACFGGADEPNFFYVGGVCGVLLSIYCLTLPNTPPKGPTAPGEKEDALGFGAMKMFKEPAFAIFAICVFFASIPACNFFFPLQVPFLSERGYPSPLALTTINQFSEILFMFLLPFFIARLGFKWVLVVGMGAWVLRYLFFTVPNFECAVIGLLLHGMCYSFLYVASYLYAQEMAPKEIKASAQSLMVFLLLGVGQVAGSQMYGFLRDLPANAPDVRGITITRPLQDKEIEQCQELYVLPQGVAADVWTQTRIKEMVPLPPWDDAKMSASVWRFLDLSATVKSFTSPTAAESTAAHHLGVDVDKNTDNIITSAEIDALPDTLVYGKVAYNVTDLKKTLHQIAATDGSKDLSITRDQYLAAQSLKWPGLFLPATIFIGIFLVLFALLGSNPKRSEN